MKQHSQDQASASAFLKDPFFVSVGIFIASSAWFIVSSRRQRHRKLHHSKSMELLIESGILASRGVRTISTPVMPYMKSFLKALQNPCDPMMNPEGYIALCIAENTLIQEKLAHRLMQPNVAISGFSNSMVYNYNSFLGLPTVRQAVAHFLYRYFLNPGHKEEPNAQNGTCINPEHVVIGSGAGGILNHLFFVLAEEGEAVLIPAPYYAKFENDMKTVAGLVPFPVHCDQPSKGPTVEDLEDAAHQAIKHGLRPKILLLNNPNSPLGTIYSPNVVKEAIQWARSKGMHTIVDEIYALSTHKVGNSFQSVLRILDNKLSTDVHFVYALSQDFGACGFHIGMLCSQNIHLIQALANLNTFSAVSQPMQMMVADLLMDYNFIDFYLEDSRMQLARSYEICARKLKEMVIPFVQAEAACFVYVDFSSLLPSQTFEGEEKFANLVSDVARVVMTPGSTMRDKKPGMFRICYAWVSPEILEIAMERLSYLVTKIRRIHWDDLAHSDFKDVTKNALRRRSSFMNVIEWSK